MPVSGKILPDTGVFVLCGRFRSAWGKTGLFNIFRAFSASTVRSEKIGAYDLNRSDYNLKQNGANTFLFHFTPRLNAGFP